jgi:flagella basal body P-ring formation protein FlgA
LKLFRFFQSNLSVMFLAALILLPLQSEAQQTTKPINRESEIISSITEYVRQKSDSVAETRIKRVIFNGLNGLPAGVLEYELVVPGQWDGWSTTSFAVIARQGNRVVGNIMARVEIEALADMVVAARNIEPGTIISAADLVLRKQELAGTQGRFLARIEDVAGKKARSTIRPNLAVRPEQIEKVPLIKTGQMVTILVENERMRITVTGKAKSSGAEGDMITVQNLTSLKDIPARVKDASTVVVLF